MFLRLKVYLIMFIAFAIFGGIAYLYYTKTQAAMIQYAENAKVQEIALATQKAATDALLADIKQIQELQTQLQADFEESRQLTKSLETLFDKNAKGDPRDFGDLAAQDPDYVTKELNTGTQEVFDCFEQMTGNTTEGSENDRKYIGCGSDTTGRDNGSESADGV